MSQTKPPKLLLNPLVRWIPRKVTKRAQQWMSSTATTKKGQRQAPMSVRKPSQQSQEQAHAHQKRHVSSLSLTKPKAKKQQQQQQQKKPVSTALARRSSSSATSGFNNGGGATTLPKSFSVEAEQARQMAVLAGLALGLASPLLWIATSSESPVSNEASPPTRMIDEEPVAHSDVSFQVLAALDRREEAQKVRLAQILHDLHKLAKSSTNKDMKLRRRGTMRRMWTHLARPTTDDSDHEAISQHPSVVRRGTDKLLSIDSETLRTMSPTKANELISKLKKGEMFGVDSVNRIFGTSEKVLLQDDTLVNLQNRPNLKTIHVVGDLHGCLASLEHVMKVLGDGIIGKDTVYVFNGDFVDRGKNSLEVLLILLLLKMAYPENVYLLRGNHEDVLVCSVYGFHEELLSKYGQKHAERIWDSVNATFCAMPLSLMTDNALILHGGLPSDNFSLDHLRSITPAQRRQIKSIVDPKTDLDILVQGILWSDPSTTEDGIHENFCRGLGVSFGSDVARKFLKRHSLQYLIRGHELVPTGTEILNCGQGRAIVTVFSHPGYPDGTGTNLGGLVHMNNQDGTLDHTIYSGETVQTTRVACSHDEKHYLESLKSLIVQNKLKLENAFLKEAPSGKIATSHWASIMSRILNLDQVPWTVLSADLTPPMQDPNTLDWRAFLQLYHSKKSSTLSSPRQQQTQEESTAAAVSNQEMLSMETLHANQDMIMTTFKFLDSDGKGSIDKKKFKAGIDVLNRRLTKEKRCKDSEALFRHFDRDGSGAIGLPELRELFKSM